MDKNTIIEFLVKDIRSDFDSSLFFGKAGILLALINYLDIENSPQIHKKVNECIESIVSDIQNTPLNGSLMSGLTGIAYALRLSKEKGYCDEIDDSWFDEVDEIIKDYYDSYLRINDLDLLRGATGVIVYLLRFKIHYEWIEEYVILLKNTAIWKKDCCYWRFYSYNESSNSLEYRDDIINLGLAHGMPMILSILSLIYKENINKHDCKELIDGTYKFILRDSINNSIYQFKGILYLNQEQEQINSSRLGWCYGDLSVGYSFVKSALLIQDDDMYNKGLQICKITCNRDINTSYLEEHGFCHGFYGTAYIYHKLFKLSNEPIFNKQSEYWIAISDVTKDYTLNKLGYFQTDTVNNRVDRTITSHLLSGISGILLCKLALKSTNVDFDNIFLL